MTTPQAVTAAIPRARVGSVILSTQDMSAALAFYRDAFGFEAIMADGEHWATVDGYGTKLSLAGKREQLGEPVALAVKVADLDATLAAAMAAGGLQVGEIALSAHERRVSLRTPDGHLISLYSPLGVS